MKAKYIGNDKNMTTSKVYEVEQYVSANDPVYGNTFVFTDDVGVRRIDTKDNFFMEQKIHIGQPFND